MNISSSNREVNKPAGLSTQPNEPSNSKEVQTTVTIDVTAVGDSIQKGVETAAGLASATLMLPRTLIAPTLLSLSSSDKLKDMTQVEACASLAVGITAGVVSGYILSNMAGANALLQVAGSIAGGLAGVVGIGGLTLAGQHIGQGIRGDQNLTAFDYKGIQEARQEARETTEGPESKKRGAAFAAGYAQAFKESCEVGQNVVESSGQFLAGGVGFIQGIIG